MNQLPLCIEEIIIDYKNQLEVTQKYDRCMKEMSEKIKYGMNLQKEESMLVMGDTTTFYELVTHPNYPRTYLMIGTLDNYDRDIHEGFNKTTIVVHHIPKRVKYVTRYGLGGELPNIL